jgi:hypothetical protein
MSNHLGIPKVAAIAINDMLDHCAKVKPGQEVLLLAQIDGLHGGDNLVDEEAISWIQSQIHLKGANASVLWIDEPAKFLHWRVNPIVKAAMVGCDIMINHSFDLVTEEMLEFRELLKQYKLPMVRNFATTASLLCTAWAQTPYELVSEIRYRASLAFKEGLPWQLTDDNGTHLEGIIALPAKVPGGVSSYSDRRHDTGYYLPWPEWVHPPIYLKNVNGVFIFDCMLSWWSRYIGISPYFQKPIILTIKDNRIIEIKGGEEAEALRRFLDLMKQYVGEGIYGFNALHFGVHPQAIVAPHQCPSNLYRRVIEHAHTSNIHVHIGAPMVITYPYWVHCTGDIRTATFRVGDTLVHDHGHLTALDNPDVIKIAEKYSGRPGLSSEPRLF